jgi:membrane-associated protease RseP (regulator of RpoE activity)
VEKDKTKSKLSALWAFLFGIILMLGVYVLFEFAPNRLRSGSTNDTTGNTTNVVKTANIVQTADVEDVSVRPSVFLGVEVISVNAIIAEQLSLPGEHGVLINGVVEDSPAQAAGLQRGDVILSLDGKAVDGTDRFRQLMAAYSPGDNVRIAYIRNTEKDRVYVQLAGLPDSPVTDRDDNSATVDWGVSLSDISSEMRKSLNIPADISGVAILSVIPGGAADEAGLRPTDVVTGIDQTPVSSMDDFFRALSSDNDNIALLDVYGQGSVRYVPLDSTGILEAVDQTQTQTTLRQKIFSIFTGGMPFDDDDSEDEEGPKGGKFAQDDVQLTADNTAFNRPSTVPGDENTGGGTTSTTGMNRPSSVPPQSGGPVNDTVLFIGLLILLILYLSYREYTRPPELEKS